MSSRTRFRFGTLTFLILVAGAVGVLLVRHNCSDWNRSDFFLRAGPVKTAMCLATGSDPNDLDEGGYTPLHRSVWSENPETVRVLLAAGANTDARDKTGSTPLHWAVVLRNGELVNRLLDQGADPNAGDENDATALQYLVYPHSNRKGDRQDHLLSNDLAEALLAAGANPNLVPEDGIPILHWAVRIAEEPSFIATLVNGGADLTQQDGRYYGTPMHWAVARDDPDFVDALIRSGADANTPNRNGATALHWAARQTHRQVVLRIWNRTFKWKVSGASEAVFPMLLEEGRANPNAQDRDGETPLHWLVRGGQHPPLAETLSEAAERSLHWLVRGEQHLPVLVYSPEEPADSQRQPQDDVKIRQDLEKLNLLLASGADLNATNSDGFSALHLAARKTIEEDDFLFVLMLLAAGADPDLENGDGDTPMEMALDGYRFRAYKGARHYLMRVLAKHGADVNVRDNIGYSPLHWAFENVDVELAVALVNAGADIFLAEDGDDWYYPTESGLYMAVCREWASPVLEAILSRGLNPREPDHSGLSALDAAARCERPEIAARLRKLRVSDGASMLREQHPDGANCAVRQARERPRPVIPNRHTVPCLSIGHASASVSRV